jgi:K+-sensing histidine kinase KdpD
MTSVQNINDIVDHCSTSQRLTYQNAQLSLTSVRVLPLIQQLLDYYPPSHPITWHILTDEDQITTDATYLRVILHNLLNNAAKYATPDSDIRITLSRNAAKLCITIDNDIQAHQLPDPERLYAAYYRAPSAQKVSGSGLGLFIVKSLVERLSGEIFYQQNDLFSVSFTVCFQENNSLEKKL